jgi:hypothetical protein
MINNSLPFVVFCPVHSFCGDVSSSLLDSLNAFLLPSTLRLSACKILLLLSPTELRQLAGLFKAWMTLGPGSRCLLRGLENIGVLCRKGVLILRSVPFSCIF